MVKITSYPAFLFLFQICMHANILQPVCWELVQELNIIICEWVPIVLSKVVECLVRQGLTFVEKLVRGTFVYIADNHICQCPKPRIFMSTLIKVEKCTCHKQMKHKIKIIAQSIRRITLIFWFSINQSSTLQ